MMRSTSSSVTSSPVWSFRRRTIFAQKALPAPAEIARDNPVSLPSPRKLRRALDAVDRYLRSQSTHLVDYAERHRAGQRVGTALTEGTANFLVNRRMAKAQQMRWTRRGADLPSRGRVTHQIALVGKPAWQRCASGWKRLLPSMSAEALQLPDLAQRSTSDL